MNRRGPLRGASGGSHETWLETPETALWISVSCTVIVLAMLLHWLFGGRARIPLCCATWLATAPPSVGRAAVKCVYDAVVRTFFASVATLVAITRGCASNSAVCCTCFAKGARAVWEPTILASAVAAAVAGDAASAGDTTVASRLVSTALVSNSTVVAAGEATTANVMVNSSHW